MAKEDMVINPITGEIDLDLHRIVKGFSKGGQSLKDSLELDTPRRTPSHPTSSHVVKTKVDGKDKMIRFGEQGAKTNQNPKQRKAFKDRHAKNIAKGKSSAAYWADKVKWKAAEGGAVETGGPVDLARNVIGQGLLLGWGDEAEAWVRSKLGEGTYEEAVAEIRAGNKAYSEDSPYASLAGEIVGGLIPTAAALVATPFTGGASTAAASGNLARLASIGARRLGPLGTAGVVGATEGAIAGAGMAEEGSRLKGAGTGAVIGGTLGTGLQKGSELAINAINKRALNKAASQVPDDSAYDALRQKYLDQGMIVQAVREPGDQILDTAPVDEALANLRSPVFSNVVGTEGAEALDNWMNTKLRKFILNEMGSKNDSVRLAADEGFTLGPGDYEKLADDAISENTQTAGTYLNRYNMFMDDDFISLGDGTPMRESAMGKQIIKLVEENPWLSKVPPETVIRDVDEYALTNNLNFQHMIDEIQNAMDPNTTLPRQLQISPKDLKKISMRQMVEKISKINDWRMKEADKVGKKELLDNIANTDTVIDLPDFDLSFVDKKGGGWVQMPDAASDSGGKVCTIIGKSGGWCTQGSEMAESYGSGSSRLYALLDGEGRPHIQLNLTIDDSVDGGSLVLGEVKPIGNSFFSEKNQNYMSKDPEYRTKLGSALKTFLNENQNDISTDRIMMGGNRDILDFGIFDMKNSDHVQAKLKDIFSEEYDNGMGYVIDNSFQSMLAGSQADGIKIPRFLTRSEFLELMDPYTIVSDSGYAKGGAVYNPNLIKKNAVQLLMEANNG